VCAVGANRNQSIITSSPEVFHKSKCRWLCGAISIRKKNENLQTHTRATLRHTGNVIESRKKMHILLLILFFFCCSFYYGFIVLLFYQPMVLFFLKCHLVVIFVAIALSTVCTIYVRGLGVCGYNLILSYCRYNKKQYIYVCEWECTQMSDFWSTLRACEFKLLYTSSSVSIVRASCTLLQSHSHTEYE
jgi:hypothetical protein